MPKGGNASCFLSGRQRECGSRRGGEVHWDNRNEQALGDTQESFVSGYSLARDGGGCGGVGGAEETKGKSRYSFYKTFLAVVVRGQMGPFSWS